jgi:hypothetical protein
MSKVAGGNGGIKSPRKPFVIHTPVWLDQHQEWISDGARRLYRTLQTLADAKSGRLFIPARGWISLKTIESRAGMCDETRKKYQRELQELGAISVHRDYVIRQKNGRKRKVLGKAQVTVLPLHPPGMRVSTTAKEKLKHENRDEMRPSAASVSTNANIHAASTTAKTNQSTFSEPQDDISTTAKNPENSPEKVKVVLQEPKSSTVEEVGHQYVSKPTSNTAREGGVGVAVPLHSGSASIGASPMTASRSEEGFSSQEQVAAFQRLSYTSSSSSSESMTMRFFHSHMKLYRMASEIILARASAMETVVQSETRYVAASLPSFYQEDLGTELYKAAAIHVRKYIEYCFADLDGHGGFHSRELKNYVAQYLAAEFDLPLRECEKRFFVDVGPQQTTSRSWRITKGRALVPFRVKLVLKEAISKLVDDGKVAIQLDRGHEWYMPTANARPVEQKYRDGFFHEFPYGRRTEMPVWCLGPLDEEALDTLKADLEANEVKRTPDGYRFAYDGGCVGIIIGDEYEADHTYS